jgi:quercetin dioxygenase-like cupin family protein
MLSLVPIGFFLSRSGGVDAIPGRDYDWFGLQAEVPMFPAISRLALAATLPILALPVLALAQAAKPPSIEVVPAATAEIREIAGGKALVEALADCPDSRCPYVGLFTGRPGLEVAEHAHDGSDEILYVLSGGGEAASGDTKVTVKAGDTVRIPKGVKHAFSVPEGGPEFRAVQVFPQGGPQERFRAGKKVR